MVKEIAELQKNIYVNHNPTQHINTIDFNRGTDYHKINPTPQLNPEHPERHEAAGVMRLRTFGDPTLPRWESP